MQYTDNEAALIGSLISNYFFQPSVDAKLRESYRRVLRHLHENTLSASDLSRIQNALTFLSPLCLDTRITPCTRSTSPMAVHLSSPST